MDVAHINTREIMVNALQRSGHHAFVLELLKATDRHVFLNCIQDARVYNKSFILNDPGKRFLNDMGLDLDREMTGIPEKKNLFVYNTEMRPTSEARGLFQNPQLQARVGPSQSRHFVTWLRDPLNNIASLYQRATVLQAAGTLQGPISAQPKLHLTRTLWQDHWRALGMAGQDGTIGLIFNRWLRDESYRRAFFDRIGLAVPDRVAETAQWGDGSSFSGFEPGTPAPSAEALESRCDGFLELSDFQRVFAQHDFMKAIDNFFETQPNSRSLTDRWERLRKGALHHMAV